MINGRLLDVGLNLNQKKKKLFLDAKCLTQVDFHETVKWQGLNVNTTKAQDAGKKNNQ